MYQLSAVPMAFNCEANCEASLAQLVGQGGSLFARLRFSAPHTRIIRSIALAPITNSHPIIGEALQAEERDGQPANNSVTRPLLHAPIVKLHSSSGHRPAGGTALAAGEAGRPLPPVACLRPVAAQPPLRFAHVPGGNQGVSSIC